MDYLHDIKRKLRKHVEVIEVDYLANKALNAVRTIKYFIKSFKTKKESS